MRRFAGSSRLPSWLSRPLTDTPSAEGWKSHWPATFELPRKEGGKIGLPEVNLGVLPGTGGTQRFSRIVGRAKALELMARGQIFSFEEALGMGLIHYIYERETYWQDVMAYAKQFCPPNKAAGAVGRIKRAVVTGSEIPFSEALGIERELQQLLFTSEDAKEGLAAYVEKRAPHFKGK